MNRITSVLLAFFFISCNPPGNKSDSSTGASPIIGKNKKTYIIPKELKEISGISFINEHEVVAIQDETGVMYFFDLQKEAITGKHQFGDSGDYEDVVVVDNSVFIVTSGGSIFQVDNFLTNPAPAKEYKTALSKENNVEGLAFDKKHNRLLLAVKDKGLTDSDNKNVYAFDLKTKQLNTTPIYSIKLADIESFFKGDKLEEASKKFLKALGNHKLNEVFRTSAITFHPTTGDLYALTSLNNMIAVIPEGTKKITKIIELKGPDYHQPEGLAFNPDARLFISNESNGKRANIIEVEYD